MAEHKFVNIDNLEEVWKKLDSKIKRKLDSEGVNKINELTGDININGDDDYILAEVDENNINITPTHKLKNILNSVEEVGAVDVDNKLHLIKSINGKTVTTTTDETGIVINNDIVVDASDIKVVEEGDMYDDNGYETVQEALDGIYNAISEVVYPTAINEIDLDLNGNDLVLNYTNTQNDDYEQLIQNINGIIYLDEKYTDDNFPYIRTGNIVYAENDVYIDDYLFLSKGIYIKYDNEYIKITLNGADKVVVTNINNIDNIPIGDFAIVESDIVKTKYISAEWSTSGDFVYTDLDFEKLTNGSEIEAWLDENKTQTAAIDGPWYIDEDDNGKYVHCPLGSGNRFYYTRSIQSVITLLPKGTYIQTQVGLISIEQNLGNITGAIGDSYVKAQALGTNIQVNATEQVKAVVDAYNENKLATTEQLQVLNDSISELNQNIIDTNNSITETADKLNDVESDVDTINNKISKLMKYHEYGGFYEANPLYNVNIGDILYAKSDIYQSKIEQWDNPNGPVYTEAITVKEIGYNISFVYTHPRMYDEDLLPGSHILDKDDDGDWCIHDKLTGTKMKYIGYYKNLNYCEFIQSSGLYIKTSDGLMKISE